MISALGEKSPSPSREVFCLSKENERKHTKEKGILLLGLLFPISQIITWRLQAKHLGNSSTFQHQLLEIIKK